MYVYVYIYNIYREREIEREICYTWNWTWCIVDGTYGVCITLDIPEFYSRINEYLHTFWGDFLHRLMASEYWEALEKSETLVLNGIGYCKTPFLA